MAITVVGICNDALAEIGAEFISSIDQDDKRAAICKRIYPIVRNYVLIAHPWVFAQKRVALAAIDEDVVFGYDYQYQLPSDCLRVTEVDGDIEYKVEGDRLLTNESSMNIRYTREITDTSKYTSNFAFAVSYLLGAKICYPITGSRELMKDMRDAYLTVIRESRSIDAQAMGTPEDFGVNEFLNARY